MKRQGVIEILEFYRVVEIRRKKGLAFSNWISSAKTIKKEHPKWESIKAEIEKECSRLTNNQKKIVLAFYVEGLAWEEISEQVHYSPQQCQYICDRAIDCLVNRFSRNQILTSFEMVLSVIKISH